MYNIFDENSTICAVATPNGSGALAIIRISGKEAINIVSKIFVANNGRFLPEILANTINLGKIYFENILIDEVLLSLFKAPKSYTGEDLIEISCHNSNFIKQKILFLLLENGCKLAEAGEFTFRAFKNGKLDLSQAEAIPELIDSQTQAQHKIAINKMRGGFRNELDSLREKLLNFASLIELDLDFSEEDIEFADKIELEQLLNKIKEKVSKLLASFSLGNAIKNGIYIAIVGKTNVGKSTLLNTLLNEERAIVSDIHGTTRDVIEDSINYEGFLFRFIDTAGVRNSTDEIEKIGIGLTYKTIEKADIVLFLIDSNQELLKDDINFIKNLEEQNKNFLIVANKIDLISESNVSFKNIDFISISAKNKVNIDLLLQSIVNLLNLNKINENDIIITSARHFSALQKVLENTNNILISIQNGINKDILSLLIREVLDNIGEITGKISNQDILHNIFDKFCIGK